MSEMEGDDRPFDRLNGKVEDLRREIQEYATAIGQRHNALEEKQRQLEYRLHEIGVMLEDRDQH